MNYVPFKSHNFQTSVYESYFRLKSLAMVTNIDIGYLDNVTELRFVGYLTRKNIIIW